MTQEEKLNIAKLIRQETGCGLMMAQSSFDKLITALKSRPLVIMDKPYELTINWK